MPTSPVSSLIEHICKAVPPLGDAELLGRFVERRDETALAVLVKRHGPMVWGVCRRLLGHHDAEDAFQATFIVLVRKAASVKPREMVGNWLYGVARQAALQARSAARRRAREIQVDQVPDTATVICVHDAARPFATPGAGARSGWRAPSRAEAKVAPLAGSPSVPDGAAARTADGAVVTGAVMSRPLLCGSRR